MDSTMEILPSRADVRRSSSGRVVRWVRKTVRSLKSGQLDFANVVESELKSKRPFSPLHSSPVRAGVSSSKRCESGGRL